MRPFFEAGVTRPLFFWTLLLILAGPVRAGELFFTGSAILTASPQSLQGELSLTLRGNEPVHQVALELISTTTAVEVPGPAVWRPGETHTFPIRTTAEHRVRGRYHLLVSLHFRDLPGVPQGSTLAFEYLHGEAPPSEGRTPTVDIATDGTPVFRHAAPGLLLTSSATPYWSPAIALPADRPLALRLRQAPPAAPARLYPQLARVEWVEEGSHHSRIVAWAFDPAAGVRSGNRLPVWPPEWPVAVWWGAAGFAAALGLWRRREHQWVRGGQACGLTLSALLSLWTATWLRPDLWFLPTWVTGGDVASHVLYAARMAEWLREGRISGWMPEVFAGFPAFHFYFPLPFVLSALAEPLLGLPIGFKLAATLPPVLAPIAAYLLARALRWPPIAALLGAAGTVGFLFTDATSIWGGNLLATLSGEFAYGWGFDWVLLFWAVLAWSLNGGGRRWLLAAVIEAAVALSHGYAILVAGFGAFLLSLLAGGGRRGLLLVLQIHTVAFLLIGAWMLPLVQNLPWTIPNDAPAWFENWTTLWPRALWPLALGAPPLVLYLFGRDSRRRAALAFPLAAGALALVGFALGSRIGLADIRFFPYAQWALAFSMAGALGWALMPLRGAPWWALALVCLLLGWWSAAPGPARDWARWNLEGYEAKPLWNQYRAVAAAAAGGGAEPRIAFEHDPANIDVGSTRALEALPLFGSRPVLEGLYMEGAASGPFVYQLQSEISARPSSPLVRFPSSGGGVDAAVAHMRELYADTLWLRSDAMKSRFRGDPRFEIVAEPAPFLLLRLRPELRSELVEVLESPIVARPREGWLERAFGRFRTRFPYSEREVYLADGEQLPPFAEKTGPARVRLVSVEPERIVFETGAVGRPHLVRISFHPKWRARGGESLWLTEPAFMLVIPGSERVELEFGEGWGDIWGRAFSLAGGAALLLGVFMGGRGEAHATGTTPRWLAVTVIATLAAIAAWGLLSSPERDYQRAHRHYGEHRWAEASTLFLTVHDRRRGGAGRSEALFWSARAAAAAGDRAAALERYRALGERYPDSYWAPESLFRMVEIGVGAHDADTAFAALAQARERYQESHWTTSAARLVEQGGL